VGVKHIVSAQKKIYFNGVKLHKFVWIVQLTLYTAVSIKYSIYNSHFVDQLVVVCYRRVCIFS